MGTCITGATGTSGPPIRLLLGRGRDGMCDEPSPLHCSPTNALSLQMLFHHQQTTNALAVGSDAHSPTVTNNCHLVEVKILDVARLPPLLSILNTRIYIINLPSVSPSYFPPTLTR